MAQVRSGSAPTPDLVRLAGARLVLGSETEEGRPLAEALVKQLTGGDRVTARDMYERPIEFTPRFKMIIAGNHRPTIRGTDNGIWRRMRLLPFNRTFDLGQRDGRLTDTLKAEADHILAWVFAGCQAYLEHGLGAVPASISAATDQYRKEEDVIGLWLAERTQPTGECLSAVLYADFTVWCESTGQRARSMQAFGRSLAARGLQKAHTRNGATYTGISLPGVMA
jgi:P4 family phage/plasmid primase-like protien